MPVIIKAIIGIDHTGLRWQLEFILCSRLSLRDKFGLSPSFSTQSDINNNNNNSKECDFYVNFIWSSSQTHLLGVPRRCVPGAMLVGGFPPRTDVPLAENFNSFVTIDSVNSITGSLPSTSPSVPVPLKRFRRH